MSLDLSRNELGPAGTASLAAGISCIRTLTFLDLSSNAIKDDGALALALAFGVDSTTCQQLEHLMVETNELRAAGAAALVGLLGSCRALHTLSLADNLLRDEGAIAVATALVTAAHRSHLVLGVDLRSNGIGTTGADALAASPLHGCVKVGTVLKHVERLNNFN